jgi:hypothetical protein
MYWSRFNKRRKELNTIIKKYIIKKTIFINKAMTKSSTYKKGYSDLGMVQAQNPYLYGMDFGV